MPSLSRTGRYTFRFHALSAGCEGVVTGVMTLNDIVLRKTLGASDAVLTFFVTGQSVGLVFPALWTDFTRGRYLRSSYLWFGLLGRLALASLFIAARPLPFAVIIVLTTFMYNALLPAQNMLFQANYAPAERGRAFGAARRLLAAALLIAALGAGLLLQWDSHAYRWYSIAVGLIGFAGCALLYRVRLRRLPGAGRGEALAVPPSRRAPPGALEIPSLAWFRPTALRLASSLANPFAGSVRTLRSDRAFLSYECYFFLYGMAFMMLQPVLPIFLVEYLDVDYSQAATAKGLIMYGMFILLSPLAGVLSDRAGPVRLAAGAFALLSLFPSLLCLTRNVASLYASFAFYGAAMAAVDVAWNMGPIHFAGERDSTVYMGAHTALVAIRALIGGPLGIIVMRLAGTPRATFVGAAILFLAGAAGMRRLAARTAVRRDATAG